MKKSTFSVIFVTIFCCAAMALVDGVLCPGYAVKSGIKMGLFLLLPLLASTGDPNVRFLSLLRPNRRGILISLGLGLGLYALILGGYRILGPYFDFSGIATSLTANAGVTRENFLAVSLYISFINSFLEEFFFRGFVFTNLKALTGQKFAYGFSAGAFALYHVAMMIGWFSPGLFLLVMAGLVVGGMIFNYLNERMDTVYSSWLSHMFANFAINTIGFLLLG